MLAIVGMIALIVCASMFTACTQDEYLPETNQTEEGLVTNDVPMTKAMSSASYYIYEGINPVVLANYYGHVYQDRTFYGWTSESSYTYTPNTNKGYPHPTGITINDYYLQYNGNCALAAYTMARGLAYKEYSLFALQSDHSLASSRRYNTNIYCETSMRLHRAFPNYYNFTTASIQYLYWMAKGDAYRISDVEFILNPSNPSPGAYNSYFSSQCGWTTAASYKTELENCMSRKAPFVTIVRIKPANHPAGNTRHSDTEYYFSGSTDVGNYIGNHTSQHYIVVVAMNKAFDSNDNFLPSETIIYFLDPYYDYHTLWHTTYSNLVSSALLSSNNRNGFGLYRPDLE